MTDEELNEAVAIKLGWTQDPLCGDSWIRPENVNTRWREVDVPDYCHGIAAAWECLSQIPFPWSIRKVGNQYWIAIQNRAYDLTTIKDREIGRAICRAFLELKAV